MNLGTDERAALIVDYHSSRYDLESFVSLNKAGIDLIILPAHSSHITQHLDRTLNKRAPPIENRNTRRLARASKQFVSPRKVRRISLFRVGHRRFSSYF